MGIISFKLFSGKKIMNVHCLKVAARTTIPVFLGYISCGIAFGLITINAGYPWWLAPAMGILIFAGAGQFLAVPLFAAGTPVPAILAEEKLPCEHFRRNHYLYDFDKGSALNLLSDVVNQFFGFLPAEAWVGD